MLDLTEYLSREKKHAIPSYTHTVSSMFCIYICHVWSTYIPDKTARPIWFHPPS